IAARRRPVGGTRRRRRPHPRLPGTRRLRPGRNRRHPSLLNPPTMTDTRPNAPEPAPQDENQIMVERRAKLASLREAGPAFPNDFVPEDRAARLHASYDDQEKEALE